MGQCVNIHSLDRISFRQGGVYEACICVCIALCAEIKDVKPSRRAAHQVRKSPATIGIARWLWLNSPRPKLSSNLRPRQKVRRENL